jgi:hypothetical protein
MASSLSLLGGMNRVESPFIKVEIGSYVFGVFNKTSVSKYDEDGIYREHRITYPNYIQSLSVKKINGQVNQYTLSLSYPIAQGSDPNFFEKVFSSVSKSRRIVFSYGDCSMPTFLYRDEEAIITDVQSQMSASSSVIKYTVKATSSAALAASGAYNFRSRKAKPSDVIKELLRQNSKYGLQDVFTGMRDYQKVLTDGLIAGNDRPVQLEYKANTSVLDYLSYLVSSMIPLSQRGSDNRLGSIYGLVVVDDASGVYGGPYFKVINVDKAKDSIGAYEIDIGYPSQNIVTDFSVDNNESYSILYDWQSKLHQDEYSYRINGDGNLERVYSPIISSGNYKFMTTAADKTWWSKVTEYPIKATITLKGLLRPAVLMTHVRLNVYYYGQKHVSSGLYIITSQQDWIGLGGNFKTTITMTRISGDGYA